MIVVQHHTKHCKRIEQIERILHARSLRPSDDVDLFRHKIIDELYRRSAHILGIVVSMPLQSC